LNKEDRGHQARLLLDHHLTQEVLDGLEQSYLAAWRAAKTVEAREDCHRYVTLLGKLKADLGSIALTGDIELEEKRLREIRGDKRAILPWI